MGDWTKSGPPYSDALVLSVFGNTSKNAGESISESSRQNIFNSVVVSFSSILCFLMSFDLNMSTSGVTTSNMRIEFEKVSRRFGVLNES